MAIKGKKKAGRIVLTVFIIIIGFVVLTTGGFFISNIIYVKANTKLASGYAPLVKEDALTPTLDENGYWSFTTDRDFVVLQLTDVHLGGGSLSSYEDKLAMDAVAQLVYSVKPDLVITTGDIAYPVPFETGSFNNLPPTKMFASLMESLGVYWAIAFGNHDTEAYSYHSREDISAYYMSEEINYASNTDAHCLFQRGPENVDGYGNYIINVKNSQGIISQSLIMIDSHSYIEGDYFGVKWRYDNIHENQINWYAQEITKLDAQNKAINANAPMLRSLAFFHIPLDEYRIAYLEYADNNKTSTENVIHKYGIAGETGKIVYSGSYEDDMFETMLSLGSTQGIFVGHDHLNNFSLEYKGIRLTYGMSIDYLAYAGIDKQTDQRGGTVITTKADGSFDCYGFRLVDKVIIP